MDRSALVEFGRLCGLDEREHVQCAPPTRVSGSNTVGRHNHTLTLLQHILLTCFRPYICDIQMYMWSLVQYSESATCQMGKIDPLREVSADFA